jgi:hypothetical protein
MISDLKSLIGRPAVLRSGHVRPPLLAASNQFPAGIFPAGCVRRSLLTAKVLHRSAA